jgi:hypothetical protein
MLEGLPPGQDAAAIEPASQYEGAHVQLAGSAPHANLILAFEYPGGWRDIQVRLVMFPFLSALDYANMRLLAAGMSC